MTKATITVVRNQAGDILLLQRPANHTRNPNEWCFPGGKVDWIKEKVPSGNVEYTNGFINHRWESYEEAAIRECLEETGVQLTNLLDLGEWLSDSLFLVKVFHATSDAEVTKSFPNREHVKFGWFNENNFPKDNLGPMTQEQLFKEFELTAV